MTTSADAGWGEPPVPDVVARLLTERWEIDTPDVLTVDLNPSETSMTAELTSGPSVFRLRLVYRRGAGPGQDPWMFLVDALDALVGMLEESGRDHRTLPKGEGVEFAGASFLVEVERHVPGLQKVADRLLDSASSD